MGERIQEDQETHQGCLLQQHPDRASSRPNRAGRRQNPQEVVPLADLLARTLKHFLPDMAAWLEAIPDPRRADRILYPKAILMWAAMSMFMMGLRSRRQFRFESRSPCFVANLNSLAECDVETAPHDDTVAYYLEAIDPQYTSLLPVQVVRRLIRMRVLDKWRLRGRFLIALDGTGQLAFHKRHCPHCLTRKLRNGEMIYYHHVLEAKLVTAQGMVFSVATEFINNQDGSDKQDCELKAFQRLAPKLKARFPRLPILLLGDALYANATFFETCLRHRWDFIATFKKGSAPALFGEFEALRDMSPKNRVERREGKLCQQFAWVNDLEHQGHKLSAFQCEESGGDKPHYFAWITNIRVGCKSVITLANQGGRLRWKIENEGFKNQKRHGYELEHAYSHNPRAIENFYYLLQLAHAINQLMVKGTLRNVFDKSIGSLRNYMRRLAESLRNCVICAEALDAAAAKAIQIRFDTS